MRMQMHNLYTNMANKYISCEGLMQEEKFLLDGWQEEVEPNWKGQNFLRMLENKVTLPLLKNPAFRKVDEHRLLQTIEPDKKDGSKKFIRQKHHKTEDKECCKKIMGENNPVSQKQIKDNLNHNSKKQRLFPSASFKNQNKINKVQDKQTTKLKRNFTCIGSFNQGSNTEQRSARKEKKAKDGFRRNKFKSVSSFPIKVMVAVFDGKRSKTNQDGMNQSKNDYKRLRRQTLGKVGVSDDYHNYKILAKNNRYRKDNAQIRTIQDPLMMTKNRNDDNSELRTMWMRKMMQNKKISNQRGNKLKNTTIEYNDFVDEHLQGCRS